MKDKSNHLNEILFKAYAYVSIILSAYHLQQIAFLAVAGNMRVVDIYPLLIVDVLFIMSGMGILFRQRRLTPFVYYAPAFAAVYYSKLLHYHLTGETIGMDQFLEAKRSSIIDGIIVAASVTTTIILTIRPVRAYFSSISRSVALKYIGVALLCSVLVIISTYPWKNWY